MANKNKLTFRQKFFILSVSMILPLLVVISGLFIYSSKQLKKQVSETAILSATLYSRNFRNNIQEVESFIANLAINDADFSTLTTVTTPLNAHIASHTIMSHYKTAIHSYQSVDALFVYSEPNHTYRDIFATNFTANETEGIRNRMRFIASEHKNWYNKGWEVLHVGGKAYLVYMVGKDGTYLAALVNLNNTFEKGMPNTDMTAVFTDIYGIPYTKTQWIAENGIYLDMAEKEAYYTGKEKQFLTVSTVVENTPLNLFFLSPRVQRHQQSGYAELTLVVLFILVLINLLVLFFVMGRSLLKPLEGLVRQVTSQKGVNVEKTEYTIKEFSAVDDTFKTLHGEIAELRIEAYETEIERQKADLQYLQLQIQPHFFLNCLKLLYGLVETQEHDKMQELIIAVSNHLRYRFYDMNEPIQLIEELSHVENYLKIQQAGRTIPINITLNIDPQLQAVLIPPFSIQTLTENSVKHGTMTDDSLEIVIKAKILVLEEGEYIDIIVTDNAGGFSQEVLTTLNYQKGIVYDPNHIGLTNLKKRVQLLYGEKAVIAFYNVGSGAVAELIIPYRKDKKDEHTDGG